jgi:hypothetical protein
MGEFALLSARPPRSKPWQQMGTQTAVDDDGLLIAFGSVPLASR